MERYVLQTTANELESIFGVTSNSEVLLEPTFNAAPGYLLPAIFAKKGVLSIESCIWESESPTIRTSEFIRSESAHSQLISNACIIPVNGFYLWKQTVNDPLPFYVRIHSRSLLGIPGFLINPEESRKRFSVFTRSANVLLKPLDDSMPCILEPKQFASWLNGDAFSIAKAGFISNEMMTDMTVYRVPDLVNELSNNGPELIQPIPKLREED